MSEPVIDLRTILQGRLKDLDAKLDKLEPAVRAAQAAFDQEKELSQARLLELGAKWRAVNGVFVKTRMERETVFRSLRDA
jgi:hypothetical protein